MTALAASQGMALTVVDAGLAERLPPHERLLVRKIAHGTRNTRLVQAMSVEQAQAALRAGMEIGESLPGNVIACAGLGVGSDVASALVLSRLGALQARELLLGNSRLDASKHSRLAVLAQTALARHRDASDPIEVLAAFGGFEIAMLSGLMLSAAQQRRLVMVDGIAACTALMVASRIAAAVTDYCLFCRSQRQLGLDAALRLFHSSAMLELNLDSTDGCGAAMSWPLVRAGLGAADRRGRQRRHRGRAVVDQPAVARRRSAPLADDPLLLRALGGDRPAAAATRRSRRRIAGCRSGEPGTHGETPGTPGGWHSPFNQGERENVSAASKVDTRREPGHGRRERPRGRAPALLLGSAGTAGAIARAVQLFLRHEDRRRPARAAGHGLPGGRRGQRPTARAHRRDHHGRGGTVPGGRRAPGGGLPGG